ncbi:MAG: hypothetical protein EOM67_12935 [Spirochaetia bacterium]|nr:hypothetical protein [Spirochaetia bacterium]
MKEQLREKQQNPREKTCHYCSLVDNERLLFQWCTGESIAQLAREYALPYHILYRLIRND